MILSKEVEVTLNPANKNHFLSLGYEYKKSNKIFVPIKHLTKGSHTLIKVKCDICKKEKEIKYKLYLISIKKYNLYTCCKKCSSIKIKKTNLEKYGVENPFQSEKIKGKIKKTNIEKYGVENPFQNEKIKNKSKKTKLENYGNENYNNPDKSKKTCLEKYGVECTSQLKENREKSKKTCLEKYGVDNYSKTKEYVEKCKRTNKEKFGTEFFTQTEEYLKKNKKTNLDRYGVENVFQSEEIKNKIKETCLEKYGYKNSSKSEVIKNKAQETCLEKYGFICSSKNDEIKEKVKKTNLEKYGVECTMQNKEIFEKQQKNCFITGFHNPTQLSYQGSYEKDFLDFCFENNIPIQKGKRIKYIYNDKEHYYFSDYYYEPLNLIIEIKSEYTYEKNLEINLLKEKSTLESGFNYLFIIDKDYEEFKKLFIL